MSRSSRTHSVEIVICVHNSLEDVKSCLTSVRSTLRSGDRVVIVDDGSDEETRKYSEEIADEIGSNSCTLIRRQVGSGFCRAANAGLRATSFDTVILLNSDTIVVGDWIDRIVNCMTANWQIGIVGPLSNSGGWQSIPEVPIAGHSGNEIPGKIEIASAIHAKCAEYGQRFSIPIVEQVNGFCFALSRELLDVVGIFDEENFPMGYGEENDLTFRALDAGFLCAIAIDCFVFHAKTRSYTQEARAKYNLAGQATLFSLYGKARVSAAVRQTHTHEVMAAIRSDARETFRKEGWLVQVS